MGKDQDLYELLRAIQQQGFIVTRTKKNHWQIRDQFGVVICVLAGTPSDHRALRNTIARMRRYGFQWPVTRKQ